MAKKNMQTKNRVMIKCECSTCGQIANAQVDTKHYKCKGIHKDILARLPSKLKDLTNPSRIGTWKEYVAPAKTNTKEEEKAA